MTREEKEKAINALKISAPVMAVTQEEFNNYIQTLNKIMDWLEQETVSKESYDHEYFLRKEFEIKIDKLQRQLEEQTVKAESILNKIRAEMFEEMLSHSGTGEEVIQAYADGLKKGLSIIDKHRAENEE